MTINESEPSNSPTPRHRKRVKTTEFTDRDLKKAEAILKQAEKYYKNGLYFDCLSSLE